MAGMIHLALLLFYLLGFLNSHVVRSMEYGSDPLPRAWSEWTQWSACSRSCGGGAKMRTRVCKMSSRGYYSVAASKSCLGENVEYELCSVQNCPPGDKEFLQYQCSLKDGQRGMEWIPYPYGPNPCELQCWSMDRTLVHSFGKAIDGTKCANPDEPAQPALCINGRCTGVDCAGQIGRDNRLDRCGVCRGNNATCVHRRDVHGGRPRDRTDGRHYEYDRIATIPSGATDILVREDSQTNFLALSDEMGDYHVNGNWRIQSPGRIRIHGSEFSYDRSWDGRESLRAKGPTRFDAHVYVLGTGDVPPVQIDYWISTDNPRRQTPFFQISNQIKDSPEDNRIEDEPPGMKPPVPAVTRFQGYRSYYHRNEILKSVPSWSAKRHGARKNPVNRRVDVQNDVASTTTVANADAFRTAPNYDRRHVHRPDSSVRRNISGETRFDRKFSANTIPSTRLERKYGSRTGSYRKEVSVTARPSAVSESGKESVSGRHLKKKDKYLVDKKRNPSKKKRKSGNDECQSCPKPTQQKKSFCASDFVLRAVMLSVQKLENSFRYELEIIQSFKNKVPISPREYVWTTAGLCRCPRLRTDHEYILMGHSGTSSNRRESRLLMNANAFARKYTPRRARTLQRLVRDQNRICKKYE